VARFIYFVIYLKFKVNESGGWGRVSIVLWKSATETGIWKTLIRISCRVCFLSVRIRFTGPAGEERTGPTFSPALFYVGERPERGEKVFAGIGAVWVVPGESPNAAPLRT